MLHEAKWCHRGVCRWLGTEANRRCVERYNRESLICKDIPLPIILVVINLVRTLDFMYKYNDNFTEVGEDIQDLIKSLFVNAMGMWVSALHFMQYFIYELKSCPSILIKMVDNNASRNWIRYLVICCLIHESSWCVILLICSVFEFFVCISLFNNK